MTSGEIVSWSLTPSFNRNENKDSISFKSLTLAFSVSFTPRDERVKKLAICKWAFGCASLRGNHELVEDCGWKTAARVHIRKSDFS